MEQSIHLTLGICTDMHSASHSSNKKETIGCSEVNNKSRLKEKLENIKSRFNELEKIILRLECTMEALKPDLSPAITNINNSTRCIDLNQSTYKTHVSTVRRICGSINQIKLKVKTIMRYIKQNKKWP